jgi:hypothetical protein
VSRLLTLLGSPEYYSRVLSIGRANLLAYWPLWEPAGTVATDVSGAGRHGAYTAVALGQPGIGDGRTAGQFDGVASYANVYSASLAGAFNGAEGTLSGWVKVASVGVWTDGLFRRIVDLDADGNNYLRLMRSSTNNALAINYRAGGISIAPGVNGLSGLGWLHLAVTWSKSGDALKTHLNGVQQGATATGLGTWAGSLAATTTNIGAYQTTPTNVWSGGLAHVALWNAALAAADVAQLARVS